MAVTKEQYLNLISQINDSTNNIAADLESIKQQLADALAAGGLTAADEEEILGKLQEAADKLKTTADSTPDGQPTPPVENPQ